MLTTELKPKNELGECPETKRWGSLKHEHDIVRYSVEKRRLTNDTSG